MKTIKVSPSLFLRKHLLRDSQETSQGGLCLPEVRVEVFEGNRRDMVRKGIEKQGKMVVPKYAEL